MNNRLVFKDTARLRTRDLLIAKMECTTRIALFKTLKSGFLGLLGLFIAQIAKSLFAIQALSWIEYVSLGLALYCVGCYLVFDTLEASLAAQKELICDLLTLRMSRTGKKTS